MTTNLPAERLTAPAMSLELGALLSSSPTVEGVALAVINADRVEELRTQTSILYQVAARPAGVDGVEAAIRPWFATYPQQERSDEDWTAFWAAYVTICGHLPEAALHGGMKAWARRSDAEFLPKPGMLAELSRTAPTAAFKFAGHAHNVLQLADDMQNRQRVLDNMERDEVKPEEQRQRVAELLAGFKAASEPVRERQDRILRRGVKYASAERAEELPYIGGECATGSALTAQMHQAMGWPVPLPRDPREPAEFDGGI